MHASLGRGTTILAAIGLVLVGLLAGILVMLAAAPEAPSPAPVTPAAERTTPPVAAPARPAPRPPRADSGAAAARVAVPSPVAVNTLFRDVAARVTPSVVYIQVETKAPEGGNRFHQFEGDMRDFFRQRRPQRSVGSGVFLDADGHVVTNHHVVERAERIQVVLSDKRQFPARVVGVDESTDLAVLQLEDAADAVFPALPLGDSDRVAVGEWVVAVGNPFRLTSTVTAGIVSALGRQVNIIDDTFRIEDFIQTDAAINPGNSGGALVNVRGELVGINTAIATESGSYEGYGFAVPSNLVRRVADDLIAHGEVRRGFLGVSIQEVDAPLARELELGGVRGVYVSGVRPGGAAAEAGVQDGDVVLAVEGRAVDAPNELQSAVAQYRPGDRLRLDVLRDGRSRRAVVTLMGRDAPAYRDWLSDLAPGARPDAAAPRSAPDDEADAGQRGRGQHGRRGRGHGHGQRDADSMGDEDAKGGTDDEAATPPVALDAWGLGVRALTDAHRTAFGVETGVYLAYVTRGGRAHRAGLPRDVVLTHLGGEPIDGPDALRDALDAAALDADTAPLARVHRRDGTRAFYDVR